VRLTSATANNHGNQHPLSSKGQWVIPKSIRDDADVSACSLSEVRSGEGAIRLRPYPRSPQPHWRKSPLFWPTRASNA